MSAPVPTVAAAAPAVSTSVPRPGRLGRSGGEAEAFEQALRAQAEPVDDATAPADDEPRDYGSDQTAGPASPDLPVVTDVPVPVADPSVAGPVLPLVAQAVAAPAPVLTPSVQDSTNVSLAGQGDAPAPVQDSTNVSLAGRGDAPAGVQESAGVPVPVASPTPTTSAPTRTEGLATPDGAPAPVAAPALVVAPAGDHLPADSPVAQPTPAADTAPVPTGAAAPVPAVAPQAPLAAPPAAQPAVPAPAPAPLHSQVVTAVTPLLTGPDGTHQLTLRLDPDGLGPVHVRLTVNGDEVRMHLVSADVATREALRDGLAELRTQLEDVGLRATQLDVGSGGDPREHAGPGADAQHRARTPERPAGPHGPAPPEPAIHAPAATGPRPDTRLDLRM